MVTIVGLPAIVLRIFFSWNRWVLFPQALIPICRGPAEVEDIIFHEGGQFSYPAAKHFLEALGDVLLPRAVHTDAFHAIAVAVTTHLRAGTVVYLHGQALGSGGFYRASLHGTLRKRALSVIVNAPCSFPRAEGNGKICRQCTKLQAEEQSFCPLLYFHSAIDYNAQPTNR